MAQSTPPARNLENRNLPIGSLADSAKREIKVPAGRWHGRGYLPHFDSARVIQHVTYHLADSLPKTTLLRLDEKLHLLPPEKQNAERRKRIDAWLDSGYGACILKNPEIAATVQAALLHFDNSRYRLLTWVIMPNHVHVLVDPIWPLAKIVASWKKFSARRIRDHLRAAGREKEAEKPIWHREYWDRFIRNETHLRQVLAYIEENPVKAGLVASADEWRWSSAREGHALERQFPD